MTSFQIASDLHIEYKNDDKVNALDYITPSSENLILAGDIGSLYKMEQLRDFLVQLAPHFKLIIYVPGNQEYYMINGIRAYNMHILRTRMNTLQHEIPNLYILDKASLIIDNICITGCTLWSRPKVKIPKYIVRIHGLNTETYENNHEIDLEYINSMIDYAKDKNYKLLIITHYCPTYSVSANKDKFSSLYMTDLDNLLKKDMVHTWICGHVHKNFDFITPGGTRVVGNQKGKPKDKINDFKTDFTITV